MKKVFHSLREETANMALLDSACTKIFSGEKWLTQYLDLLP